MNLLPGFFLAIIVILPIVGFVIHRVILFTDKLEKANAESSSIKEFIKILFSNQSIIDWLLMPIYLALCSAIALLFAGIALASIGEKNE